MKTRPNMASLPTLVWAITFASVWVALAWPRVDAWFAWFAGLLAVSLGVYLHDRLGEGQRVSFRLLGLARFLPYFVAHAIHGGIDVARRALTPSLPIAPGFTTFTLRLPEGPARVFFANCLSLLPGTFSARLDGPSLLVHFLSRDADGLRRLAALEDRVAALFGLTLGPATPLPSHDRPLPRAPGEEPPP